MEAILGADDFNAEQAERYGWINRALPDADLDAFVARLARRIASFPADAVRSAKRVLNELTLPGADAIRANAVRFRQLVASDTAKGRTAALFTHGRHHRSFGKRTFTMPSGRRCYGLHMAGSGDGLLWLVGARPPGPQVPRPRGQGNGQRCHWRERRPAARS